VTGALDRLLSRRARGRREWPSDPRLVAFARGLALGALVGAAIAGSSVWARFRREQQLGDR
jgi:hypothetical protein